jgi:hypothetical protein
MGQGMHDTSGYSTVADAGASEGCRLAHALSAARCERPSADETLGECHAQPCEPEPRMSLLPPQLCLRRALRAWC